MEGWCFCSLSSLFESDIWEEEETEEKKLNLTIFNQEVMKEKKKLQKSYWWIWQLLDLANIYLAQI